MKRLLLLLMMLPALAFGQRTFVVELNPVIGSVVIDSVTTEGGSDTLKFFRDMDTPQHFVSAMVGGRIIVVDSTNRLPFDATVLSIVDSNQMVLSDTIILGDDSLATVQVEGVFGAVAYGDGDAIGPQMEVNLTQAGRVRSYYHLVAINVADSSDQGAAISILMFNDTVKITADNAAMATDEGDGFALVGAFEVDSWLDKGQVDWAHETPDAYLPNLTEYTKMYVQVFSDGTPTYTSASSLRIWLTFLVE